MHKKYLLRVTGACLPLCIVLFALPIPGLIAETYQWTDRQGTVHFTDDLSKIPEPYEHEAVPVKVETGDLSHEASSPGGKGADLSGSGPPGTAAQGHRECQDEIDRSIVEYDKRFKEDMNRLRGYYQSLGSESSISKRKELEKERDALLQQMDKEAKAHEEEIGREQQLCDAGPGPTTYHECVNRLNSRRLQHARSLETDMLRLRTYSREIGSESNISKRRELEKERDALAQRLEQKAKAEEFDRELDKCQALRASE